MVYESVSRVCERRRTLLVTSASFGNLDCKLPDVNVVLSESITGADWRALQAVTQSVSVEVVVGIGGGSVMDVAKLRGAQLDVPVTLVPSVLSTDAFLTTSAAVRDEGRVCYLPAATARRVVIDEALLLRAPAWMNALGSCDVLSMLTAADDWRRDCDAAVSLGAFHEARRVCESLLAAQDDIAAGTLVGLNAVLDGLIAEVRLCAEAGSDRLEEGSEHFFAYALESRTPRQMHGVLVGLGILFAALLQGQDVDCIVRFFRATGIAPACLSVSPAALVETLIAMPRFVRDGGYPPSVWNRVALNEAQAVRLCDDVLAGLRS